MNSATLFCSFFPTKGFLFSETPLLFVNWTISNDCNKIESKMNDNNHSSTFIFTCPEEKVYTLSVNALNKNDSELKTDIYINFNKCNHIYWYGFSKDQNETGRLINNGSEVFVWPISSLESNSNEINHLINLPYKKSKKYSLSMNKALVIPKLTMQSLDGALTKSVWSDNLEFDYKLFCWRTKIYFKEWRDFRVKITSNDKFQGIELAKESFEYFCPNNINFGKIFTSNYFNGNEIFGQFNFKSFPKNITIRRHPVIRSLALFQHENLIITTQNDFDSLKVFQISKAIKSIILTEKGISWLEGIYAFFVDYELEQASFSPVPGANSLSTFKYCDYLLYIENSIHFNNIIVAAHISTNMNDKKDFTQCFYFTIDSWKTSQKVIFNSTIYIFDFNLVSLGNGFIIFMYYKNGIMYTRTYAFQNFRYNSFYGEFDEEISFNESGLGKAVIDNKCFIISNRIGQIFVVCKEVFISTDIGKTFHPLKMISFKKLPNYSHIRNIEFSYSCKCAIIYETGEIFILFPNHNYFVQIQALGNQMTYLKFDYLERLCLLYFRQKMTTNITFSFINHPLIVNENIEIFSFLFNNTANCKCSYVDFNIKYPDDRVVVLDKNTKISTFSNIISKGCPADPLINRTGSIQVSYNISLLHEIYNYSINYQSSQMNIANTEINLTAVEEGVSYISIFPKGELYQYTNSTSILNVYTGCPAGRHIQLKGGNEVKLFYSKTRFKPELELYDYENKVDDVGVDFVIYMVNRTKDIKIKYCQTAGSVGCRKSPQNWKYFIENNITWDQSNYESCFEGEIEIFNKFDYYNIMNKTDHSCIILMPVNYKYYFQAIVIDPKYSYCHLSTNFTVTVYGEPLSFYFSLTIIGITIIICFILILCTYTFLNKSYSK